MNILLPSRGERRSAPWGRTWHLALTGLAISALAAAGFAGTTPTATAAPGPKTVSFANASYQVTEGQTSACVYVSRSVTKGKSPIVTVQTTGGTATAGVDYATTTSTAAFARRQSQVAVCVPILVDEVIGESDETVTLTLTGVSGRGWTLGTQTTATLTIHEMAVPGAPTNLAANVVSSAVVEPHVHLTWTAPSIGGVHHYLVMGATAPLGPYTQRGTTTGTSFDLTPAPSVDTYYLVEAISADGASSDDSNQAFAPGFVPGSGLYWAAFADNRIVAANPDGTGIHPLVTGEDLPLGVAVDGTHVYWANYGNGTIRRANLDGTGVTTLVSGRARPYGVAVNGSYIYWSDLVDDTIMRADLDGGNVTTLVTGEYDPSSVAVTGSYVYWVNWLTSGGTIKRADLDGGNVTTLVSGQALPFAVAVDSSYLYWVNQGEINSATGTVMRASLTGSDVTTLVTGQWHPDGIAVDGSHVYWANSNGGTISRASLNGSSPTVLVSDTSQPAGVAVSQGKP